jgi:hypothetical protein
VGDDLLLFHDRTEFKQSTVMISDFMDACDFSVVWTPKPEKCSSNPQGEGDFQIQNGARPPRSPPGSNGGAPVIFF